MARDADVDFLYACYLQYRTGKRTLADAAYFCLTVLERRAGTRDAMAKRYAIHKNVLRKIGDFTANKGGPEARKIDGVHAAFTGPEQQWLEETMKCLVRRASEVAYDPSALRPVITLSDLPPV
jgi:hypothetical protein